MSDLATAELCKKQQKIARQGLSTQYNNTMTCLEFYNGDSMSYEDRIQFIDDFGNRRCALVQFNKVRPPVDAVVGFMAQNRRQAKYIARMTATDKQQVYSKNMNALYGFHRERTNSDQIETDQDADMMINGYGATETDLSYIVGNSTTDPNGEIIKMRLDPMRTYWDPMAKAKNLLDARWAGYWEDFDLREALDLFQGSKEEDFERVGESQPNDTGYIYNPWGGLYDKIKLEDNIEWANRDEDLVRVYNHQWYEYETFYRADNPIYEAKTPEDASFYAQKLQAIASTQDPYEGPEGIKSGDMFDFDPMAEILTFDDKMKRLLIEQFDDLIQPVSFKRKCFYTAVLSGRHVFTKFKSICQQGFSIKFKTGIYNAAGKYWVGMVNDMMQPAEYSNKALTELMFTIASNSKGGVMVEEDAVEDIEDFESKWVQTDSVIIVAPGAIAGQKILQKAQPALPTGLDSIIQLSDQAVSSAGVDPSFLGANMDDGQSGILYKRRIRQVISKMARYFDSITMYQKEDARLCADLIRVWVENNAGQWVRITGPDNKEVFQQVSEDMMAPEYDVDIQEAPQSPEDQQQTSAVLGTYGDKLMPVNPQAGLAFYAESLNYLTGIDADVRNRLIQTLQPQKPQIDPQQFQAMQQQLQALQSEQSKAALDKVKSETKKTDSETMLNMAKTQGEVIGTGTKRASTAKALEEAARTSAETHLIRSGKFKVDMPKVTV
jgi:hypothetical protein